VVPVVELKELLRPVQGYLPQSNGDERPMGARGEVVHTTAVQREMWVIVSEEPLERQILK